MCLKRPGQWNSQEGGSGDDEAGGRWKGVIRVVVILALSLLASVLLAFLPPPA